MAGANISPSRATTSASALLFLPLTCMTFVQPPLPAYFMVGRPLRRISRCFSQMGCRHTAESSHFLTISHAHRSFIWMTPTLTNMYQQCYFYERHTFIQRASPQPAEDRFGLL